MTPSLETTWPINDFYNPVETASLFEAISHRQSCRRFHSAPSTQQWNDLNAAAGRLALPGSRLALGLCNTTLFQPFFGLFMKFENVQRYAAVIAKDDQAQSVVNAGVSGEMLMLYAVSLGLAGVWVAGTYKRKDVTLALSPGERIVALIALGVPLQPAKPPLSRKRKALRELCQGDLPGVPAALREIPPAVQAAPSALNAQPWRMRYEPDHALSLRVTGSAKRLDLGIATAHAVLALGKTPALFTLSDDGLTVRISLLA